MKKKTDEKQHCRMESVGFPFMPTGVCQALSGILIIFMNLFSADGSAQTSTDQSDIEKAKTILVQKFQTGHGRLVVQMAYVQDYLESAERYVKTS
ncbi:MAG: hypothetical protein WCS96_09115, partial [Victivallales bacterium]